MALAATAADETWKTKEISAWRDDEAKVDNDAPTVDDRFKRSTP
jgi:hypothetical protein